jgi:hypothetical protein
MVSQISSETRAANVALNHKSASISQFRVEVFYQRRKPLFHTHSNGSDKCVSLRANQISKSQGRYANQSIKTAE